MNAFITRLGIALLVVAMSSCGSTNVQEAQPVTQMTDRSTACGADLVACARTTTIGNVIAESIPTVSGEPVQLGMINQEQSPVGSFPELSDSVEAAVKFINTELGGIHGRPIELVVCNAGASAESSLNCAERFIDAGVVAVLGGIDIFGAAISLLERNGTPYIGGIPVSSASMTSPGSFQWSGGAWAASVAFADYIVEELSAKQVAIVHGEFDSITQAANNGKTVLEANGIAVTLVPFPVISTDLGAPLSTAAATNPDAVIILTADTACRPAMESWAAIGPDIPALYVGACADPTVLNAVSPEATRGAIFNVEGIVDPMVDQPDFDLYQAVLNTYDSGLDPVGPATVTFRSMMNLYRIMSTLDADALDSASIIAALQQTNDEPSFMGHLYTCDGKQFPGLPAACSPQQIIVEFQDGEFLQRGSWRNTGAILSAATRR